MRGKALKEAVISKLRRAICFIEYGNLLLIGVRDKLLIDALGGEPKERRGFGMDLLDALRSDGVLLVVDHVIAQS